jgi:hypothetical protein
VVDAVAMALTEHANNITRTVNNNYQQPGDVAAQHVDVERIDLGYCCILTTE